MYENKNRPFFSINKNEIGCLIVGACCLLYLAWNIVPKTRLNPVYGEAELEYKRLHDELQLGITREQAKLTFTNLRLQHLQLYEVGGGISVYSPPLFDARDWVMGLEFRDDRLVRIWSHIRDNYTFPKGAPPDKSLPEEQNSHVSLLRARPVLRG